MDKGLKLQNEERLHDWCKRLALCNTDSEESFDKWFDILHEVSVQSYIRGVNAKNVKLKQYGE